MILFVFTIIFQKITTFKYTKNNPNIFHTELIINSLVAVFNNALSSGVVDITWGCHLPFSRWGFPLFSRCQLSIMHSSYCRGSVFSSGIPAHIVVRTERMRSSHRKIWGGDAAGGDVRCISKLNLVLLPHQKVAQSLDSSGSGSHDGVDCWKYNLI